MTWAAGHHSNLKGVTRVARATDSGATCDGREVISRGVGTYRRDDTRPPAQTFQLVTTHHKRESMFGKNLEQRAAEMQQRQNHIHHLRSSNNKLRRDNERLREELKTVKKQLRELTQK